VWVQEPFFVLHPQADGLRHRISARPVSRTWHNPKVKRPAPMGERRVSEEEGKYLPRRHSTTTLEVMGPCRMAAACAAWCIPKTSTSSSKTEGCGMLSDWPRGVDRWGPCWRFLGAVGLGRLPAHPEKPEAGRRRSIWPCRIGSAWIRAARACAKASPSNSAAR
jgi:hypothetical protein